MSTKTTLINELNVKNIRVDKVECNPDEDLTGVIFDMSHDSDRRMEALNAFYSENGENTIEIVNKLCNMYSLSGTKLLQSFLEMICHKSTISALLKLITVKGLLSYKQKPNQDATSEEVELINTNNEKRRLSGYKILYDIACNMQKISTPQQLDVIFSLMEASEYKEQSLERFCVFLSNHKIQCNYRYKTILELEQYGVTSDTRIIPENEFFIREALLFFIFDDKNMTMYRILSGQYLLQNHRKSLSQDKCDSVQNILLSIAEDTEMDFNLRADAADTLLNVGDKSCVDRSREIIVLLSFAMNSRRTVFDNAQNVHVEEIENSVSEILSSLMTIPMCKLPDGGIITFEFVRSKIESMISVEKAKKCSSKNCKHSKCLMCNNCVKRKNSEHCNTECEINHDKKVKILISINRISVDRVLYSRYSITLSGILLRVWSYIVSHEASEELRKRLLEELYDMSGTCSSGFASRLINVVSGFGEFNIQISWRDQIVANFTGRLNALARKIDDKNSIYYTDVSHLNDIVMLYISSNPDKYKITKGETKDEIVKKYLKVGKKKKIEAIIDEFKENVISEMSIVTTNTAARSNFLKFFRDNMLKIREEMYNEFREYMTDTDFDLWFRSAIMSYETGHTD